MDSYDKPPSVQGCLYGVAGTKVYAPQCCYCFLTVLFYNFLFGLLTVCPICCVQPLEPLKLWENEQSSSILI